MFVFESKHLSEEEKVMLHGVLSKYELPFYGTLCTWKTKPVDIELHPDYKLYCTDM